MLCHVKHGGGDVEGVRNQIDRNRCFHDPPEKEETIEIVQIVAFDHHADELVAGDECEDYSGDGDDHGLRKVLYHRKDAGIPALRGLPDLPGDAADLRVDRIEQAGKIAVDGGNEEGFQPGVERIPDERHRRGLS